MHDDELKYWGEYGRMAGPSTLILTPYGSGDMMALWNAFGALEAKVRSEPQS